MGPFGKKLAVAVATVVALSSVPRKDVKATVSPAAAQIVAQVTPPAGVGAGDAHTGMGPGEGDAGVGPALPPTAPRSTSGCGCLVAPSETTPAAFGSALAFLGLALGRVRARRQRGASQNANASSR